MNPVQMSAEEPPADAPSRLATPHAVDDSGKQNLVDLAYGEIKRAIMDNVFPPGFQAAEVDIAKRLDMSRTPVHEAMARLQEDGLVRILPRRGILVRGLTVEDVEEIYDVIIALEGAAAARLAKLKPAERQRIVQLLEASTTGMQEAIETQNLKTWARADETFHDLLVSECGNRRLQRIVGTVNDQLHRARMFTLNLRPLPVTSSQEHRTLIAAIVAGDVETASVAARLHRTHARDQLLPLISKLNLSNL